MFTKAGTTLTYAYDNVGNITRVSEGSKTISYEQDLLDSKPVTDS